MHLNPEFAFERCNLYSLVGTKSLNNINKLCRSHVFFLSMIDCIEPTFFIRWSPGQASFQLYHFSRQARQAAINQLSKNILKTVFCQEGGAREKILTSRHRHLWSQFTRYPSLSLSLQHTRTHTHILQYIRSCSLTRIQPHTPQRTKLAAMWKGKEPKTGAQK